jgi:hypothetical protein
MLKINLRERGIYALPDGREFVVHAVFRGGYVLYTTAAWEFFGMHAYESDDRGQLRLNGRRICWHIEDLTDTSRTAHSRSRSGAAQTPFRG